MNEDHRDEPCPCTSGSEIPWKLSVNLLRKGEEMKGLIHAKPFLTVVAIILGLVLAAGAEPLFAADSVVLKVAMLGPKHIAMMRATQLIMDRVEQASNGRLKFEYYYSDSLIPAKEAVEGLKEKIADIATIIPAYTPGKLPLLSVGFVPVTGNSYFSAAMAMADLCKTPELEAELGKWGIRYLSHLQTSSNGVWSKKVLNSIADMKGMKIRSIGAQATLVKALGAVPVATIGTEIYTALQRGTLDGAVANPTWGLSYRFQEPCSDYLRLRFGATSHLLAITKDAWGKIPADLQKMFEDLLEETCKEGAEIYEGSGEKGLKESEAAGKIRVTTPSPEDVALLEKTAQATVWKDWVEKMNKAGLPGQRVLDNWLKFNAKWERRM